ncbi:GNAT family N-acetyltransferase [Salinibacterium sp. NK8237]|uniref:GNAT family N-acetyltransferase n=1 Tax=Salinibacterium sp. NK8237 TaxID=2792038 RepID=UPI0018CDE688|nr:GNAT family N-acetyltransferase [Salinibacterium sp. NK8237]MBH0130946.1 GNAT family N-acetyltransferase [Salinibacterium sp. NK8237]
MTTTVRRAIESDAELLHEIARQTFPLACPATTTLDAIASYIEQNLSVSAFRHYLTDPAREVLLAEVDGQPAGYAMFSALEPGDPDVAQALTLHPTVELSKCYVLGLFHGAGVAPALIGSGIAWARGQGFVGMWLGVNQENARANRFYEKMGFELMGTKKFLVGERWEDDFVRQLSLSESLSAR